MDIIALITNILILPLFYIQCKKGKIFEGIIIFQTGISSFIYHLYSSIEDKNEVLYNSLKYFDFLSAYFLYSYIVISLMNFSKEIRSILMLILFDTSLFIFLTYGFTIICIGIIISLPLILFAIRFYKEKNRKTYLVYGI